MFSSFTPETSSSSHVSSLLALLITFSPIVCDAQNPKAKGTIDRKSIVQTYNLRLNASHSYSPLQLGNGNFGFGTDITGLQTFLPHNILSSWAWHNSSLPTTPGQTRIEDFTGLQWWTHDRLVPYAQPNPAQKDISQWLISNPHRINLGRLGLWFGNGKQVLEEDLENTKQEINLWSGVSTAEFEYEGEKVIVTTVVSPEADTVGVKIESRLVEKGELGVFFDYPYASGKNKFDAPFVGLFNATANHTTTVKGLSGGAEILHKLDATSYVTEITWEGKASISRESNVSHKYILTPSLGADTDIFSFTAEFAPKPISKPTTFIEVRSASETWWESYWRTGAFISLPTTNNSQASELQRRIIHSQYLLAVNGAGRDPPQESGLVNNGWYGKFHMEMVFWHLAHWQIWNKWSLYDRSIDIYDRFLPTSFERARDMGYEGARFGKMSDPTGRSAPGEINSVLIWQQPHPMYFAEMEWRNDPSDRTLKKWENVLKASADYMASYAWWNDTKGVYDLGPPMYPVSENTNPNQTINPTFELAYWRFGLRVAEKWMDRLGKAVPEKWVHVRENLAKFPVENGVYVTYEGIKDMWTTSAYAEDHPGLLGIYGWLPPDERLDIPTFEATIKKVYSSWNFTHSYGWDFPLLAMAAARTGDAKKAVEWLLDVNFAFDEVGMPVGGARVPTPYFPASAGLLLTIGMMAGGWDGKEGGVFPEGWNVEVEGFAKAM